MWQDDVTVPRPSRFVLQRENTIDEGLWVTLWMSAADRATYNRHPEWDAAANGRGATARIKALAQRIADETDATGGDATGAVAGQ